MTTQLSVIEVAELYGFNRQTVYKRINKGELSKNSDGKIDLAEAIRVFGEPASRNKPVTPINIEDTAPSVEVDMLREQVDILREQLRLSMDRERLAKDREEVALDREQFYQNQIEMMQRLLMAPKPSEEPVPVPDTPSAQNDANLNEDVTPKAESTSPVDKDLHAATSGEKDLHSQNDQEKPKKGFWSSLFQ